MKRGNSATNIYSRYSFTPSKWWDSQVQEAEVADRDILVGFQTDISEEAAARRPSVG